MLATNALISCEFAGERVMRIRDSKRGGKRRHKPAIAAMVLGALVSFQAGTARADDTAAEIRLLKARLKQLEERVAEQGRREKETQAQLRHAAAQPPGAGAICLSSRDRPSAPNWQ